MRCELLYRPSFSMAVVDLDQGEGIVAESGCQFLSAISFPDTVHAGLAVERLGTSSIVYRIALFRNDEADPCAIGRFVHVYVDRNSRRPVPIPGAIRAVVEGLKRV